MSSKREDRLRETNAGYEAWIAAWPTDATPEELTRLREERDNAVATLTEYSKSVEGMHRTIARLREENAVLRRGLHRHAGLDYEDVLADEKDDALKETTT